MLRVQVLEPDKPGFEFQLYHRPAGVSFDDTAFSTEPQFPHL